MTMKSRGHRSSILRLLLTSLGLTGIVSCGGGRPDAPQLGVARQAVTNALGPELTQLGYPIAKITHPAGGGSKNPQVIRDGVKPDPGTVDATLEYDTYESSLPLDSKTDDWIGYQFNGPVTFARVLFQEGMQFDDGGWFATLGVQVRQNGTWITVSSLSSTPPYVPHDGTNFTTYTLDFAPITGDAIRIDGAPGGDSR